MPVSDRGSAFHFQRIQKALSPSSSSMIAWPSLLSDFMQLVRLVKLVEVGDPDSSVFNVADIPTPNNVKNVIVLTR